MENVNLYHPIVTLITDFGLADEYVGVLKGVILSYNPAIKIVDISHQVSPQDIRTASHLLGRSYSFFPPGTVHLVIVDPGVGTDRPVLAIHSDSQYFIGPDNGVLASIVNRANSLTVHRITESSLFLNKVSNTFHGRDIMAPVAAQLASGLAIDMVGPRISPENCQLNGTGPCLVKDGVLLGEITHVDRFGNLCTNISRQDAEKFSDGRKMSIQLGDDAQILIDTFCSSYADQEQNTLLVLYDSHDFLEIAENRGNASERLQLAAGSKVFLLLQ